MAKPREALSPAEWRLMKTVWRLGKATIREIHSEVEGDTDWAYSTVKTQLERMENKGLLRMEKVGPVKQYSAIARKKDLVPRAVERFLDTVLDGSMAPLVRYIAKARSLEPEEIEALEKLIEEEEA
ncbi:MAG: BlaI/MecI/CopY family transcriptional regulator [Planctomycetota bacterium]